MSFNGDKCAVMVFGCQQQTPDAEYTIAHKFLLVVQETKYLGVTIQTDLKLINHNNDKISKAKRRLGMIKQALFNAPAKAQILAYTSLCRPQLEYEVAVWDPSLQYLIKYVEQVQNNAIRFIAKLKRQRQYHSGT